jgi:phosphoribosylformylglycinamidine synthase
MKAAVVVFPGSNCDRDVATALRNVTGHPPRMLWHKETEVPRVDLIVVPGGFSFGDYLRPGAMAAHSPIMRTVKARAEAGVLVLGICNGFQVLCEAGMLPGVLMRNAGLRFACKDVFLRVDNIDSAFTRGYRLGQVIRLPIAHNEGNFFANRDDLDAIEGYGGVAFRYCDGEGATTAAANPNGSQRSIAGVLNNRRNVLGMMPHPERASDEILGGCDGRAIFEAIVTAVL